MNVISIALHDNVFFTQYSSGCWYMGKVFLVDFLRLQSKEAI